eukprot:CAMPEP_0198291514 /NCGR_PEP_ID=MMETSP1449-20131203/9020_1 /TAXON_ID=420275 /ORGANISM="Attheya septentrionalis, Strain CCMP2084" /LENGTH=1292 /DNA_ID=CAMNT_0043990167 /DNA_START=337 /DNA_END=4215 /DNA_ORIENTATION=+
MADLLDVNNNSNGVSPTIDVQTLIAERKGQLEDNITSKKDTTESNAERSQHVQSIERSLIGMEKTDVDAASIKVPRLENATSDIVCNGGSSHKNVGEGCPPPVPVTASSNKRDFAQSISYGMGYVPEKVVRDDQPSHPQSNNVSDDDVRNHKLYNHFLSSIVDLSPIPKVNPLPRPTPRDIAELEGCLQISSKFEQTSENSWREDWSGNLQLIDKEIVVNTDRIALNPQVKPIKMIVSEWVSELAKGSDNLRVISLLFAFVYHMKGTPDMAKKIMAYAVQRSAKSANERLQFVLDAVRRISHDPTVLMQDGWTTIKAQHTDGPSGGAFLIGERIIWQKYEAVVIAFVRDEDIGDLWKAIWLEDLDTFDLEADELQEGMKKWLSKDARKKAKSLNSSGAMPLLGGTANRERSGLTSKPPASIRFAESSKFTVAGIDHGIILAASFNPKAHLGVFWPARVMHVSEIRAHGLNPASRRSSSKNEIYIVFLAPYWNGQYSFRSKSTFGAASSSAKECFSTGPMFEVEAIEVSATTIQPYPYGGADSSSLSIDKLRSSFKFLGLPGPAFDRFLDSHRLAACLKHYARWEHSEKSSSLHLNGVKDAGAFAALSDSHPMSVQTAIFPSAVLNLPFDYILKNLPGPKKSQDNEEVTEPTIRLHLVLEAMRPPFCWEANKEENHSSSPAQAIRHSKISSGTCIPKTAGPVNSVSSSNRSPLTIEPTNRSIPLSTVPHSDYDDWILKNSEDLWELFGSNPEISPLFHLGERIKFLIAKSQKEIANVDSLDLHQRREKLKILLSHCLMLKAQGDEDIFQWHLSDIRKEINIREIIFIWRKSLENIYKRVIDKFSTPCFGNKVTTLLSDSRCNEHITADGSFERAVRLPAAIRGAKQAGFGSSPNLPLITKVDDHYMKLAEDIILPKAHKTSYLKRMKSKILALPSDAKGVPLTDDSEGEGGEDTMGSRGSYAAALAGVAVTLKGVDLIVKGECVNAFCAVRPPGHHAGRELHPMDAISNGFCLLNPIACAALYAATSLSEGGLGLKRVCVIDFDVHHGNGTQDILCSVYDPRFLYVSLHAGGALINGFDEDSNSDDNDFRRSLGGRQQEEQGIFPGRCGDTSPHQGVLNIPLGKKVTASAIGNALVGPVSSAVEAFAPDLILLSAGFDAHKNDPLGMGGLTAEDFGSVTELTCQMAHRLCSGRILSVLEGGYGVPCCKMKENLFLPDSLSKAETLEEKEAKSIRKPLTNFKRLDLGEDVPEGMEDRLSYALLQKLDKCHAEGFLECVKEHVGALAKYNCRSLS